MTVGVAMEARREEGREEAPGCSHLRRSRGEGGEEGREGGREVTFDHDGGEGGGGEREGGREGGKDVPCDSPLEGFEGDGLCEEGD